MDRYLPTIDLEITSPPVAREEHQAPNLGAGPGVGGLENIGLRDSIPPHGGAVPILPEAVTQDAQSSENVLPMLRRFHLGDPIAKRETEAPGDEYLPALLGPYRAASRLHPEYPLFLYPPPQPSESRKQKPLGTPLAELLENAVAAFAPEAEQDRVLKDNLHRLTGIADEVLIAQGNGPTDARPVLSQAGKSMQDALQLDEDNRIRLETALDKLMAALPADGQLLGYGRQAAIHLLLRAVSSRMMPGRAEFRKDIEQLATRLRALLATEWSKSDAAIEPRPVRDSVGPAGTRFLDPVALSEVMDHSRGSKTMPLDRYARIQEVLEVLDEHRLQGDFRLATLIHSGAKAAFDLGTTEDPTAGVPAGYQLLNHPDPCIAAMAIFDQEAGKLAKVFRAVRIARLEIEGRYDGERHDSWFANFGWQQFSQEELHLVPVAIALTHGYQVAGDDMSSFSRLLKSGRPVQILVEVEPGTDPGAESYGERLDDFRTELGYVGISYRQVLVGQSSAARPFHLLKGFLSALDVTHTGLHLVSSGLYDAQTVPSLDPWLLEGAALESRAHPFFRFHPQAHDTLVTDISLADNPQPEADWPVYRFPYRRQNGDETEIQLAFSFADYTLLESVHRDHFRLVPDGLNSDTLTPVAKYLSLEATEATPLLPFIWAVDADNRLHRVVISRELIVACWDRQNFWHTLQELSGVRNRHVEQAVKRVWKEARTEAAAERERLRAEHAETLDRVRNETAAEAMRRLSEVLMGLDLNELSLNDLSRSPPPPKTAQIVETDQTPPKETAIPGSPTGSEAISEEMDEAVPFDEPWIDSVLCTSCNDCTNLNPQLFVYDENKQARIGDLKAGTYAQLVEAAELCPARCIHPGKPLNPNEPGLEGLMVRAAPFNEA